MLLNRSAVLISFWKINSIDEDELSSCKRCYTIENPLFLPVNQTLESKGMPRMDFLHQSHCGKYVYFFTSECSNPSQVSEKIM
jgi:hypothetical protein